MARRQSRKKVFGCRPAKQSFAANRAAEPPKKQLKASELENAMRLRRSICGKAALFRTAIITYARIIMECDFRASLKASQANFFISSF